MKNTKTQKKNRADFQTRFKVGHKGYKGSLNGTWKGDKAGYVAIHSWLKSNFGKPTKCENKLCVYPRINAGNKVVKFPKRFTWALLKGKKYSHNRNNFIMLCMSCHKKYDQNIEKIRI